MGTKLSENEIEQIPDIVQAEFPGGPALQQVHLARTLIGKEAEKSGKSYLDYVRQQAAVERRRKKRVTP